MFILSTKAYDFGKRLVQIYLPAISALYFGLASIWGLPEPGKVTGTIACIQVFLGVCLGISTKTYQAMGGGTVGTINVIEDPDRGTKTFELDLSAQPEAIENSSSVTFDIAKTKLISKSTAKKRQPPATK